jgi:hypothetical protein
MRSTSARKFPGAHSLCMHDGLLLERCLATLKQFRAAATR